jgi:outer membrane protein TolC
MKSKLTSKAPLLFFLFVWLHAHSQNITEMYIKQGLENNLVLKAKSLSLEKSLLALKEAKSLFLPTTWLEGQYTLAAGGRTIDIPVGDLVNPVYKTLNQLTSSNKFPTVSNVSEQFLPNNFYDVRIKTTVPVFNSDIRYNRTIKEQEITLSRNEVDIYKRELVKEIKTAYYNYLMSENAIAIYQNALEVVKQNLKVNQSLLNNGKGLPAYVSRAESEVKSVEGKLQSSRNEQQNAKAYFNFLLNRPLIDSVIIEDISLEAVDLPLANSTNPDVGAREELKSLSMAKDINGLVMKMNTSFRLPKLNAFADMGSQGFDFKVNSKSFFYLGGLQLQIPIFTGHRNLYKIQQTGLDAKALEYNSSNTQQQLELVALTSRNNIISAYNNYLASVKEQEASQKYFKLIDKGYSEGVNSFIEFLDARNQLTNSNLEVNINKFKLLATLADYERQTASYSFK